MSEQAPPDVAQLREQLDRAVAEQQVVEQPGIQKQPVPTAVKWELIEMTDHEGGKHVLCALSFATPVGTSTYFMEEQNIRALNDGLSRLLPEMKTGPSMRSKLIVPQVDASQVVAAIEKKQREGAGK